MKSETMVRTEVVSTDRRTVTDDELKGFGFYHTMIGIAVMGLLLSSCASLAGKSAMVDARDWAAEQPRAFQVDEIQIWNPVDRSEFRPNRSLSFIPSPPARSGD